MGEEIILPIILAPVIVFLVIVAPIWIIAHYITKWRASKTISGEDEQLLGDLWQSVERMESRIGTIERILDLEGPARLEAVIKNIPTDRIFFTTAQAAAYMFLTPNNLRAKMSNLDVVRPVLKLGQSYLWTRDEVVAAVEAVEMHRHKPPDDSPRDGFTDAEADAFFGPLRK